MGDIKKIPIKIGNREYHVSCTEDEEYIRKVEYYLEKRLKMVMASSPSLDIVDATNLVAFAFVQSLAPQAQMPTFISDLSKAHRGEDNQSVC